MKKITLLLGICLFSFIASRAQMLPCDQTQVSSDFQGGFEIHISGDQRLADDFIVTDGTTSFTAESITVNIFSHDPIDAMVVEFYANDAGLPGAEIVDFVIYPTSQTVIGGSQGFDLYEVVLDFPNPPTFAGSVSEDTTYWLSLTAVPVTTGAIVSWEGTPSAVIGNFLVFKNPSTNYQWYSSDANGPGYDTVFKIEGTCEGEALGTTENTISAQVVVHPNPVTDILYLDLPASVSLKSVTLYNPLGKQISVEMDNNAINLADLASGLYILKLQTDRGVLTKKIVKH